jgi:hypothetical protein
MAAKVFRTLNTDSRDLNLVQDNINNVLVPLLKDPYLDGINIINIDLIAGQDNLINHKLGRDLQGWIVVDKDQFTDIKRVANTTSSLILTLRTEFNCRVSLRVF